MLSIRSTVLQKPPIGRLKHKLYFRRQTNGNWPIAVKDEIALGNLIWNCSLSKIHQHTWSVVSTVNESPDLTLFFAAYHLAMGAKSVHIYLDDPDDEVFEHLSALKGCVVSRCTDEFWSLHPDGIRPKEHRARQNYNSQHCYDTSGSDWLFHIDADEFIFEVGALVDELSSLPEDVDCLILTVFERGYSEGMDLKTIFSGVFKRQFGMNMFSRLSKPIGFVGKLRERARKFGRRIKVLPNLTGKASEIRLTRRLFGEDANKVKRGFTGHTAGKSATRCGKNHFIGIHFPRVGDGKEKISPPNRLSKAAFLIHFEGMTRLGWASKRVRTADLKARNPKYITVPRMMAQINSLLDNNNHPDHANVLHKRLQWMTRRQEKLMRSQNRLLDLDFDVESARQYLGPDIPIDLSPEAFDNWLWRKKGPFLEKYGFEKGPEVRRKTD